MLPAFDIRPALTAALACLDDRVDDRVELVGGGNASTEVVVRHLHESSTRSLRPHLVLHVLYPKERWCLRFRTTCTHRTHADRDATAAWRPRPASAARSAAPATQISSAAAAPCRGPLAGRLDGGSRVAASSRRLRAGGSTASAVASMVSCACGTHSGTSDAADQSQKRGWSSQAAGASFSQRATAAAVARHAAVRASQTHNDRCDRAPSGAARAAVVQFVFARV